MYYLKMVTLDRKVLYNPPPTFYNKNTIVMIDFFVFVFFVLFCFVFLFYFIFLLYYNHSGMNRFRHVKFINP